jgi:hypothetical protein
MMMMKYFITWREKRGWGNKEVKQFQMDCLVPVEYKNYWYRYLGTVGRCISDTHSLF